MGLYDQQHIRDFYDEYADSETKRWDKSIVQQVKLHVHQYFLHQYLKQGDTILELGAGTGVFTKILSDYSSKLVVTDLSPVQLKLNKEKAEKEGFASKIHQWALSDICDLSSIESNSFDKIVCYGGPLSYVFEQKHIALKEMKRVLKPGGIAFLGVMNLWGSANQSLFKIMLQVEEAENEKIMQTGNLHPSAFVQNDHHCHMFTAAELTEDIQHAGFNLLKIAASNCLSVSRAEELETIKDNLEKWTYFLDLEVRACQSPGMIESGTHLIAIVQKNC